MTSYNMIQKDVHHKEKDLEMNTGKPNVRKISQLTGFSPATVSNALNRKRGVNKETAERIFQVAEELGYSIAGKGIKHIKFVLFRRDGSIIDDNPFHNYLMEGVQEEAAKNGLDMIFVRLNYSDPDYREKVYRLVNDPSSYILLLGTEMESKDYELFQNCKGPIVILDGWCHQGWFDGVAINNTDSAGRVVNYLRQHGHREIGYIKGRFRIEAFRRREAGFYQAMLENGLAINPDWMVTVGTQTETAYQDMMEWLKGRPGSQLPTAFFADNDLIAFGAMKALWENDIHIPEDVSLVGFDDLPYCAVSIPPLTTVHVHKHEMGRMAVRQLLRATEKQNKIHFKMECCTSQIERKSVRTIEESGI